MKSILPSLALGVFLGASLPLLAAPASIPNGDFETGNGDRWAEVSGGGAYSFSYPDSGGNPGGYGVIDHTANDGGFGIWVANDNAIQTLASLDLTAGKSYHFSLDMRILSGTKLGGFKVDFFGGNTFSGSTGDVFPAVIGDGTTWETYTFDVTIPNGVDGVKLVPLWGAGSSIGYDNLCVDSDSIVAPPIPNPDFENGGANWFALGGPNTSHSYPEEGGNPGRYGVMTNNGAGFGIWVANGGAPILLDGLGFSGGDTVSFMQDMRIFSGSNIGGLKVEFLKGATFLGDTGDMIPELVGDGSTWETYAFEVSIPGEADQIKIVPLWGVGSSVGYDNFTVGRTVPARLSLTFMVGTTVNWTPPNEFNLYQPQKSEDGIAWSDLGPEIIGTAVTSALDLEEAAFYRVLESPVAVTDAFLNGGFETPNDADPALAESWRLVGSQAPTRTTSDFRRGAASLRIRVQNNAAPTANVSELQQDVFDAGGMITPGQTYDFSFWAKQVSSGVSYVQNYRIQWLAPGGAILPGGTEFTPFAGGTEEWTEVSVTGLVAPEGAETAFVQIFGATGAVPGGTAQGEVLIDDLALTSFSTEAAAVELVTNGDFELLDPVDFDFSENWVSAGTQPPLNVIDDSRSPVASMELKVENDESGTPNSSEMIHNTLSTGVALVPGARYDFSFWAKQGASGVGYVQNYSLEWLDESGGSLTGGVGPTAFSADLDEWTEIRLSDLQAPEGAVSAVIKISAATEAGSGSSGSVFIDDVSLAALIKPAILDATVAPGLKISWPTQAGFTYQVLRSAGLEDFADFGSPIVGDGEEWSAIDAIIAPSQFYSVLETAP